jgi:hypothetical protein
MKTFIVTVLLSAMPAAAIADKDFTEGPGETWDCATDPNVNINHAKGKYTLTGDCKTIAINGDGNTVAVATAEEVNVNGATNKVTVGTVATINVNGVSNKVTWKKASSGKKPAVNVVGLKNSVAKAK